MKKNEPIFPTIFFPILILIIGIVLIFWGIKHQQKILNFMETAIECEALITKIDEEYNYGTESYFYTAYVEYTVKNQKYSVALPEHNGTMYVGKKVKIYYDSNNPTKIITPQYSPYITIAFGFIFTLLSLAVIISIILSRCHNKENLN